MGSSDVFSYELTVQAAVCLLPVALLAFHSPFYGMQRKQHIHDKVFEDGRMHNQMLPALTGGQMDLDYGSVWDWDTLGRSLTLLALEAVFFLALTLLLDRQSRHGTSICSALTGACSR